VKQPFGRPVWWIEAESLYRSMRRGENESLVRPMEWVETESLCGLCGVVRLSPSVGVGGLIVPTPDDG
jgi:hypothetical protein